MERIKSLIKLTPQKVRYRASYPKILYLDDKVDKSGEYRTIFAKLGLGNEESTGDVYTLNLRCHGTKKNPTDFILVPDSLVWLHCSCPYFTYYLETVLQLHGSSQIYNSNGNLPKITNPRLRPYLCKHLYALSIVMMDRDKKKARRKG
jgi:hypothetical protein